jgi:hypothetical protein
MLDLLKGIGYTLLTIILGKILFYFVVTFITNVYYYFNQKKLTKKAIKDILGKMLDDQIFIKNVSDLTKDKNGINEGMADQIIQFPFVQRQIMSQTDENRFLRKATIEAGIKEIITKAWGEKNNHRR